MEGPCAEKSFEKLGISPTILQKIIDKVGYAEPDFVYDFSSKFWLFKIFWEKNNGQSAYYN